MQLILKLLLIFAAQKRKVLFFKHFPQGSKSFLKFRERQQGVTKNKLYNAKG
jgi:hypothetical protein